METDTATETARSKESHALRAIRDLVQEFAGLVREHFGERVERIWLYGSAARGDWVEDSDIDVLVLVRREEDDDMAWLVRTAYRIGLAERHLLLQPVMLTTAEFDRLVAKERRFALDVLREGMAA